jgi:hypothetical protein
MKNPFIFIALLTVLFTACKEVPPVITPLQSDNNGQVVPRRALIEEFTGVRCVNCPAGTADILNLQSIYKDRLIAIGIHAGSFSLPYTESTIDFRTEEGNNIINLLGRPLGYPSAVVNRKKFDGEFNLQVGRSQWAGFLAQELATPPVIDVKLSVTYSKISRKVQVKVDLTPLQALSNPEIRVSVMILEDKIVNEQLTPDGKQPNYVHRHNLRKMLTPYDGEIITNLLKNVATLSKNYSLTLPDGWFDLNCSIVAFAHLGGDKLEVLQAVEAKLF